MIHFPPSYPLTELLGKETKELVQNGFPFFDPRWLKSEDSLQSICLKKIIHSPLLMNSENLKKI